MCVLALAPAADRLIRAEPNTHRQLRSNMAALSPLHLLLMFVVSVRVGYIRVFFLSFCLVVLTTPTIQLQLITTKR